MRVGRLNLVPSLYHLWTKLPVCVRNDVPLPFPLSPLPLPPVCAVPPAASVFPPSPTVVPIGTTPTMSKLSPGTQVKTGLVPILVSPLAIPKLLKLKPNLRLSYLALYQRANHVPYYSTCSGLFLNIQYRFTIYQNLTRQHDIHYWTCSGYIIAFLS